MKCFRAKSTCLCSYVRPVSNRHHVVVLAHPKESRRSTSTGRLIDLSLTRSSYFVSDNVDQSEGFKKQCAKTKTYLLFPSANAVVVDGPKQDFVSGQGETHNDIQFVIIDATWHQAQKMYAHSSFLQSLPKASFVNEYRSKFKFRTQPAANCLSSIETVYYLFEALERKEENVWLMDLFLKMVDIQVNSQKKHHPNHYRKWENGTFYSLRKGKHEVFES